MIGYQDNTRALLANTLVGDNDGSYTVEWAIYNTNIVRLFYKLF
jgi:hypothetical protein